MPSSLNLEPVRVLAVILDDKTYPELFKKYGEWASIGGIVWEYVKNPTTFLNHVISKTMKWKEKNESK